MTNVLLMNVHEIHNHPSDTFVLLLLMNVSSETIRSGRGGIIVAYFA